MKFEWFGVKIDTEHYRFRRKPKPKPQFKVGDAIVYPQVGIGVIVDIKNVDGMDFFSISMARGDMRIIVPINKMDKVGATLLE
jgi:RNA polymerase-interacting CarD/CdnL/TRCF family regulator